jgi:cell division protein ZapA (FtsZ GTPase activity inhibitor)
VSAVSIKVTIAGRTYPLTIDVSEELAVKNAAESINASIKNLQENYAVKDMLDLLAMSALQLLVENNGAPAALDNSELEQTFKVELEEIESELSNIIQS